MTDWRFKIHAYLHDPPDKPFALGRPGGHAAWGNELAELLAGRADPNWAGIIQRADWLASGADRSGMLPPAKPSLAELRHPLSGQPINLGNYREIGPEAEQQAKQALLEEFQVLQTLKDQPAAAFLALWCLLPLRLRSREGPRELRSLWDLLPAETRMPNHSVAVHQSLTSALAAILQEGDEPALLSFSVGPVQKFIETARRTSDLWGGSAILSRVLFSGLTPIVRELGPDHVVFPALRHSSLFLQWLRERSEWSESLIRISVPAWVEADISPALPNRFVAIVPHRVARSIATQCEEGSKGAWHELVCDEAIELQEKFPRLRDFCAMAKEQAKAFLQVYWAVSPWPCAEIVKPNDGSCERAAWIRRGTLPPSTGAFIQAGSAPCAGQTPRPFKPNGGSLYPAAYGSVEFLLDSVKRTRRPSSRSEHGLKCSLCGERGVFPEAMPFEDQKTVWADARHKLQMRGAVRRGEALCGVCWAKRSFARREMRVPSTAELAATPFKLRILASFHKFESEAAALVDALKRGAPKEYFNTFVVPSLLRSKWESGLKGAFAAVAGEILLSYPREKPELEDEAGAHIDPEVFARVAALRHAAAQQRIAPPRPYLAVLLMDGDRMGKWLSGERNQPLEEYLSRSAAEQLKQQGAADYLANKWPMTPALHGSFSEACAVFSQYTAARTLHHEGLPAFLVYAGGDDVMALTAIGCHDPGTAVEFATQAALNLRLRFSGHVSRDEKRGDIPDPNNESGFVIDPQKGLMLAFGKYATASAGIAVFHYKWPLNRALAAAREAEKFAKEQLDRDALAITILRRSGQITSTGMKFFDAGHRCILSSFQTLCHAFAFGDLSPRYLSEVKRRLDFFNGGMAEGQLLDLARPIIEQAIGDHCENPEKAKIVRQAVLGLEPAPTSSVTDRHEEKNNDPPDLLHLRRWTDLIEAAAFLGRGEEP